MGEERTTPSSAAVEGGPRAAGSSTGLAGEAESEGLDQPEDEATEHALRLMDEALRRSDAGRRWLVAGDP